VRSNDSDQSSIFCLVRVPGAPHPSAPRRHWVLSLQEDSLHTADDACTRAKRDGGNRIVVAERANP